MVERLLYGLNEAGEPAFTQSLSGRDGEQFREYADKRLAEFHTVEVWEGPLCILRLRRRTVQEEA